MKNWRKSCLYDFLTLLSLDLFSPSLYSTILFLKTLRQKALQIWSYIVLLIFKVIRYPPIFAVPPTALFSGSLHQLRWDSHHSALPHLLTLAIHLCTESSLFWKSNFLSQICSEANRLKWDNMISPFWFDKVKLGLETDWHVSLITLVSVEWMSGWVDESVIGENGCLSLRSFCWPLKLQYIFTFFASTSNYSVLCITASAKMSFTSFCTFPCFHSLQHCSVLLPGRVCCAANLFISLKSALKLALPTDQTWSLSLLLAQLKYNYRVSR